MVLKLDEWEVYLHANILSIPPPKLLDMSMFISLTISIWGVSNIVILHIYPRDDQENLI